MKSRIISLTAIASALVALCLTIGVYFEVADFTGLIIASAFVILPLYFKSIKACFLCYFVGGVIALILSGFNVIYSVVFPAYFLFFGIYPIIKNILYDKKFNKIITFSLGFIWGVATIYGMFYYYSVVMGMDFNTFPSWVPSFISDNFIYFIGLLGAFYFIIYDRFVIVVRIFFNYWLKRILK